MNNPSSEYETRVHIDENCLLARWADWQAHALERPIAAFGAPGYRPMMFVADEILVSPEDQDLIEELVKRHKAIVIPSGPPPLPPADLVRRSRVNIETMPPLPLRLHFPESPRIRDGSSRLQNLATKSEKQHGDVTITSEKAASLAALVAEHAVRGRPIGLNFVGSPHALPLYSATEGRREKPQRGGSDPFQWSVFSSETRIVQAWQLIESYRQVNLGGPTVLIGILDSGFWLDEVGRPIKPNGQIESDFGNSVLQVNLLDENAPAGGASGNKCHGTYKCPWHGNAVASAAAAKVNNSSGAAGAGGTVAQPVFFKTDLSFWQIYRCLQICVSWGVDVLNMSFDWTLETNIIFWSHEPLGWDRWFQFASDNGLVVVAAAGNDGRELPDFPVLPATRTPGVITVGALNMTLDMHGDFQDWRNARSDSNYGSSVSVWAPGTLIPVAPDAGSPNGSEQSGTSLAAPIVAGVAAMMRFVNPSLDSNRIRQILSETGWKGTGHVGAGLDAYAAVLAAMDNRLPDFHQPNDSPSTALDLFPLEGGSLGPGFASLSHGGDQDWWRFRTDVFAEVDISIEWYDRLGALHIELRSDDSKSRGPTELSKELGAGTIRRRGLLATGTYRLRVTGSGPTAYQLRVHLTPKPLGPDEFEPNDSFDTATELTFLEVWHPFKPRPFPTKNDPPAPPEPKPSIWGPGGFNLTLHENRNRVISPDYFRFKAPRKNETEVPRIAISQTDSPIDVTLFDSARQVIRQWPQVRDLTLSPPEGKQCFLEVTGVAPTRYSLWVGMSLEIRLPEVNQESVPKIPKWWHDPVLEVDDPVAYYFVEAGVDPADGDRVVFQQPTEPVSLQLLNLAGEVVREGHASVSGSLEVTTIGLERGSYILQVSRDGKETPNVLRTKLKLHLVPPINA